MDRVKNIKRGISMGLINNVLTIFLPFISRTIIIRSLGMEYVGLGSLFTSILQVLSLSELGFGTAIGFMLYKPLAEKDIGRVNSILSFFRKAYRIVGLVILVLSACLIPFLDKLIAGSIPEGVNIYVLYCVYVINTVISYFFFAYKKILLSANQRYDVEVNIASGILIAQYIVQIILLLVFKNYYVYVVVIPIMTLIGNFVSVYYVNKLFPGYFCQGKLCKSEIWEVMKNTGGAFFSKIGSTVYLSADNIVISAFLGLSILGVYNNYYYVISSLIAIFGVVHNSIRPVIGNVLVTESKEESWVIYKKTNQLYMMAVIVFCSCCYSLFQDFEKVWAGPDNLFDQETVALLVIFFFSGRMSSITGVYLEAAGILWQGKFIPLVSSLLNLAINLALVNIIGLKGVIISSIIGYLFVTFPGYTHIVFKYLFKEKENKKEYIKTTCLYIAQLVLVTIACYLITNRITVNGWGNLVIKGVFSLFISITLVVIINIRSPYIWTLIKKRKRD